MATSGAVPTLFCSKCGTPTPATAQFCMKCGTPLPAATVPSVAAAHYGGFWIRVLAYLIDAVIVGVCCIPLLVLLAPGLIKMIQAGQMNREPDPTVIASFMGGVFLFELAVVAVQWLYEALMTSSAKQATVGKLALGMKVVDLNGNRISFGRATGRYFGKVLSHFILYVGYIMVAFTQRKQGLHDMLASTLVVKS